MREGTRCCDQQVALGLASRRQLCPNSKNQHNTPRNKMIKVSIRLPVGGFIIHFYLRLIRENSEGYADSSCEQRSSNVVPPSMLTTQHTRHKKPWKMFQLHFQAGRYNKAGNYPRTRSHSELHAVI